MTTVSGRIAAASVALGCILSLPVAITGWHPCCLGKVGVIQARPENAPLWVAVSEGFFDRRRLEIEVVGFRSAGEVLNELGARKVDVGYGLHMPQIIDAAMKNRDFQIIGSVVNMPRYYLVGSSVAVGGLSGQAVGLAKGDDVGKYLLVKSLEAVRIEPRKVTLKEFASIDEMVAALKSKNVDVLLVPVIQGLLLERLGFKIGLLDGYRNKLLATYGVVTSTAWVKGHSSDDPRLVELMTGLIKAHNWLMEPKNKERAIGIIRSNVLPTLMPLSERIYAEFIASRGYLSPSPGIEVSAIAESARALAFARGGAVVEVPSEIINAGPFSRARK